MVDMATELGRTLGKLASDQDVIKQNISPDEAESQDFFAMFQFVELQGELTITQMDYPTDSFILDHPVYGELDSAILKLDGGYETGLDFPVTFPVTFGSSSSQLYNTTF